MIATNIELKLYNGKLNPYITVDKIPDEGIYSVSPRDTGVLYLNIEAGYGRYCYTSFNDKSGSYRGKVIHTTQGIVDISGGWSSNSSAVNIVFGVNLVHCAMTTDESEYGYWAGNVRADWLIEQFEKLHMPYYVIPSDDMEYTVVEIPEPDIDGNGRTQGYPMSSKPLW